MSAKKQKRNITIYVGMYFTIKNKEIVYEIYCKLLNIIIDLNIKNNLEKR